ncbi:hypothetical protein H4S03_004857, partial [Coemansia sp. S3946]
MLIIKYELEANVTISEEDKKLKKIVALYRGYPTGHFTKLEDDLVLQPDMKDIYYLYNRNVVKVE